MVLARRQRDAGHEHLLHRDAPVLERVTVIVDVVVVVVGIGEEVLLVAKDVAVCQMVDGKTYIFRFARSISFLSIEREALTKLVAQIGRGVAIANDLDRFAHADGAVVGGQDDLGAHLSDLLEEPIGGRVAEPALCQGAVCGLTAGQLADHLALGASVR